MDPKWFMNHTAYTMAKYGMSMCVLGMAEEQKRNGIAVNALWPKTAIWTAAMEMLGGGDGEVMKQSRKPEIMSDAAYAILTKDSRSFTGNFVIDEILLQDVGVDDKQMDQYACEPGHELMLDFFLDADDGALQIPSQSPGKKEKESEEFKGGVDSIEVVAIMDAVKNMINEKYVQSVAGIFVFKIKDGGVWYVDLKNGSGSVGRGDREDANSTLTMTTANFIKIFNGKLNSTSAFMTGRLRIDGDMMMAMKLEKIIKSLNRSKL